MGADGTVVITSHAPSEHDLQQQRPPLPHRVANGTRSWASRFFPWSADKTEVKLQDITKARYVPWAGLGALALSGLTILFSWIVLRVIDGHKQREERYLKPASWLSAILSGNSVLLGYAMSEGITIAWWFTVSRRNATVWDIHEAWSLGSSLFTVLRAGKRFNYIALATLFAASIPLNGLLLQNAITTVPGTHVNTTMIKVGMAPHLPKGFSADLSDGSISTYGQIFSQALLFADRDLTTSRVDPFYINAPMWNGSGSCGADDLLGTCTGRASSPGFAAECVDFSEPFDIDPRSHNGQPFSAMIFSSKIDWDVNTPGEFNLTLRLKDASDCVGHYLGRHCIFRAAQVEYPIALFPASGLDEGSILRTIDIGTSFNVLGLEPNTSPDDDHIQDYLTVPSEADSSNTTYGGVASYLKNVYEAELNWDWNGTHWHINSTGKQAKYAVIESSLLDDPGRPQSTFPTSSLADPDYCRNRLDTYQADGHIYLEDQLKDRLRHLMFLSSVMQNNYDPNVDSESLQNVTAQRTTNVAQYKILYRYWAGSLAVTVTIICMIIPTFWGFWLLSGKLTLSPVDTATALEAPVVLSENGMRNSKSRLKEIGSRPLSSVRRDGSATP
ncbi:hypothetical protein A1O7_01558 [Cladophialophora yegresii CBS 114405]|uniref:Uncharacterized protein n=1 Tax=Cladophialophora yegresii CBS 114405 TaxID=1182544 RepID=W9WAS8_9EURO|nr:uncharacterized protein A1O7_01558 [Cladophialophora yegresii CBS 114405]EXJ65217.1 hypothetical protein A1O7_01558 [Cladophialophora yegresii CBS 114405]